MNTFELIKVGFAAIGTTFMLISAIGIVRLPDVYARMHAAGKASTLGVSFLLLTAGLHFGGNNLLWMLMLIALFYATAPIATTTMARATYRTDRRHRLVLHHDDMASRSDKDRAVAPEVQESN